MDCVASLTWKNNASSRENEPEPETGGSGGAHGRNYHCRVFGLDVMAPIGDRFRAEGR
jgi:hypothetical protein